MKMTRLFNLKDIIVKRIKGTIDIVSSDPPFIELHVQLTLVPFQVDLG